MSDTTTFDLAELGYVGALDPDGLVAAQGGLYSLQDRVKLSQALVTMLNGLKLAGAERPQYFVQTQVKRTEDKVRYRPTQTRLFDTLALAGVTDVKPNAVNGVRTLGTMTVSWGQVPPVGQLAVLPTVASAHAFPEFWISGPGRAVAELVDCGHGYHLTDSCPNCDAEQEASARAPETATTAASAADRHLDLVPREDLQRATEKGRRDAEQATPEQREALLEVVLGPTPQERQRDQIRAAIELAHETGMAEQVDVRHAFVRDIQELGPVRATRLWARKAMQAQTVVDVWQSAVDHGNTSGDWRDALNVAERLAVRRLQASTTPTRNAVDGALATVQGRKAAELLDTIESFRKAAQR